MSALGRRKNHTGLRRYVWAVCAVSCFGFCGCGSLSLKLEEQAARFSSGKREEAYYLQAPSYRMRDLLTLYTCVPRSAETADAVKETDGPSDGWSSESVVCSDSCVSSRKELDALLIQTMEEAALGAELHFDRTNYLITIRDLADWIRDYEDADMTGTIGLEHIRVDQSDRGKERIWYISFSYEAGQKEILEIRKQTKEAAETAAQKIREENRQPEDQARAVWKYMVSEVSCLQEEQAEKENPAYSRADGALLCGMASGQGYARAAKLLLDCLEIENELTAEPAEGQEGKFRFQNLVKLADRQCLMDCCFGAVTKGNEDFFQISVYKPDGTGYNGAE